MILVQSPWIPSLMIPNLLYKSLHIIHKMIIKSLKENNFMVIFMIKEARNIIYQFCQMGWTFVVACLEYAAFVRVGVFFTYRAVF